MEPSVTANVSDIVSISSREYRKLIMNQELLFALRDAGVDNWDGYSVAIASLEEVENGNPETA